MESCKRNKRYFFWLLDPWFITWSKNICDFTKDFQCWVVGMKEEDHTLKLKIVNGISVQIVQFSSVTQSCLTLCHPMDCSMPGFSVHHQLPGLTQTHVHWVGNAIQPPHPLSSPSPPALNLSQHQGLFKWFSSLHQVAKVLELQLQHQSFQWVFRIDLL